MGPVNGCCAAPVKKKFNNKFFTRVDFYQEKESH